MNYKKARGYLSPNERQFLFEMAQNSETIINVGVEYGASIFCFAEGSNSQTKIIAMDLVGAEKFDGILNCETAYLDEYNIALQKNKESDLINETIDSALQKIVVFIKGDSNTIPIETKADLIFIDGCHWGKCFQNDIDKYSALCTKYLLFHDYSDSPIHAGVKEQLDNWTPQDFKKIKQIDTIAVYERIK